MKRRGPRLQSGYSGILKIEQSCCVRVKGGRKVQGHMLFLLAMKQDDLIKSSAKFYMSWTKLLPLRGGSKSYRYIPSWHIIHRFNAQSYSSKLSCKLRSQSHCVLYVNNLNLFYFFVHFVFWSYLEIFCGTATTIVCNPHDNSSEEWQHKETNSISAC